MQKAAAASIAVSGADADKVTRHENGAVIDGSAASDTFAVFTARVGEDAVLDGGSLRFTLTVAEAGKADAAVAVTLDARTDAGGNAAVFCKEADGSLARISAANAAGYANGYYPGGYETNIDFGAVDSLAAALQWVDKYALSGEAGAWQEYVIRLHADQTIPQTAISGITKIDLTPNVVAADYVKIRLRGHGRERTIKHDTGNISEVTSYRGGNGTNGDAGDGLLNVGWKWGQQSEALTNHIAVQLENRISFDAAGGADIYVPNGSDGPRICSIIEVGVGGVFIVEPGSKLTNYNGVAADMGASSSDCCAVNIYDNWYGGHGEFIMNGGEISKITLYIGAGTDGSLFSRGIIARQGNDAVFRYRDGAFFGNTNNKVFTTKGQTLLDYNDPAYAG